MRSSENNENSVLQDTSNRLSSLSIVIDDFDSAKNTNSKELKISQESSTHYASPKPYTRQSSDVAIKKILEEAEHRKHEFWKLIDEHDAVIENIKRIEQLENKNICKMPQSPIKI